MLISFNDIKPGYDVLVVGAGRAGYSFVQSISSKFNILVIDAKGFPRAKACSGILIDESRKMLEDCLDGKILSDPAQIDIEYIDFDNNLEGLVKSKGFVNTDRIELDKYFYNQIKNKENVDFVDGTKLIEFDMAAGKDYLVGLCESDGSVKSIVSKYIIGCDGATSLIRRKIFKKETKFYVAIQELVPTTKKFDKAFFILDNSLTDFYCWVIPKKGIVEIGGLFYPHDSNRVFNEFKKKIETRFGIVGNRDIEAAIVLRPANMKDICLGKGNVFLCGEAGGLISPRSAEGISYALQSGKFCANALNSRSNVPLLEYKKNCAELLKRLEKEMYKSKVFSDIKKRKELFK